MADSDSPLSPPPKSPLSQSPVKESQDSGSKITESDKSQESSPLSSSSKDSSRPLGVMIKDLDESQSELLSRIQGLKQNVQGWRLTVDTQLKSYRDELSGLKQQLETELEQLSTDFKELKTTLQKQQEDVTNSLKHLGLQDVTKPSGESEYEKSESPSDKAANPTLDGKEETSPAGGSTEQLVFLVGADLIVSACTVNIVFVVIKFLSKSRRQNAGGQKFVSPPGTLTVRSLK